MCGWCDEVGGGYAVNGCAGSADGVVDRFGRVGDERIEDGVVVGDPDGADVGDRDAGATYQLDGGGEAVRRPL